jgi:hypothetical protein
MPQQTLRNTLLAASAALMLAGPLASADTTLSPTEVTQLTRVAETSQTSVEYRPIAEFNSAFVDEQRGRNKIAYSAVKTDGAVFMAQYMRYLSNIKVTSLSRDDQLAYWLNTRNLMIVQAMAEAPNRRRLSNLRGTASAPGSMWTQKRITVEGVELSIDDIEQGILLTSFNDDPNLLYGLYQGTTSGPTYPEQAFTGSAVRSQLASLGQDFVNSRSGVKAGRSKVEVPAIYDWYGEALFGGDTDVRNQHLIGLSDGRRAERLSTATEFKTRKFGYSSDELVIRQQNLAAGGAGGAGGRGFGGGGGGGGGS